MVTDTQLTNAGLMARHIHNRQVIDQMAQENHAIEVELKARMAEVGATVLLEGDCKADLVPSVPTWDYGKLRAIIELVPPAAKTELDAAYVPAHEEVVQVAEKFNVTKLKPLAKYDIAIGRIIEDARLQGEPRIRVTRKE